MKMLKLHPLTLNSNGFSHVVIPMLIVIGVATVGTYMLVSSYANSTTRTAKLKPVKILSVKSTLVGTPVIKGYATPGPCIDANCGSAPQLSWCVENATVHFVVKTRGSVGKVYHQFRQAPLKKTAANRYEADWQTSSCIDQSKGTQIKLVGGAETHLQFLAILKGSTPPAGGGLDVDGYTIFPRGSTKFASKLYVNVPPNTPTVPSPPLQ